MPNHSTRKLENEAREELLSSIRQYIPIEDGYNDPFLDDEFGIEDTGELPNISLHQLQKITDVVENLFG